MLYNYIMSAFSDLFKDFKVNPIQEKPEIQGKLPDKKSDEKNKKKHTVNERGESFADLFAKARANDDLTVTSPGYNLN